MSEAGVAGGVVLVLFPVWLLLCVVVARIMLETLLGINKKNIRVGAVCICQPTRFPN